MALILRITELWFTVVAVIPGMREGGFIFIMFCKSTGQLKGKELLGGGGGDQYKVLFWQHLFWLIIGYRCETWLMGLSNRFGVSPELLILPQSQL